jgi:hypothetical protein
MANAALTLSGRGEGNLLLAPATSSRWIAWLLHFALLGAASLVLLSFVILTIAHFADRYQVNFVSSVYTALAVRLNQGTFYPDLYDGANYAGTRYMPLHFVLHAGLARLTGEYLMSGRLLTGALTILLCGQLFVILRKLRCDSPLAMALTSLVLVSNTGFLACTTIRGDLLPVVLQLAALMMASESPSSRRAALAGVFCTLALLTKLTAGWAPLAIACWYFPRRRVCCGIFLATWLGTLLTSLALLQLLTSGRIVENLLALSASGAGSRGAFVAPLLFLWRIGRSGVLLGILIPLLIVETGRAVHQRQLSIYHLALFFCLPILLVIYSDMGADSNHLLDLVVLALALCGSLWSALPTVGGLRWAMGLVVVWTVYMSWADNMVFPLMDAMRTLRQGKPDPRYPAKPLAGLIADDETILSEDPWVAIARNKTPCILDPFALARLSESRPQLISPLKDRILGGEFTRIVLLQPVDECNPNDRYAWEVRHFGRAIVQAIRSRYRLETKAEGYFVYAPKEKPQSTEKQDES